MGQGSRQELGDRDNPTRRAPILRAFRSVSGREQTLSLFFRELFEILCFAVYINRAMNPQRLAMAISAVAVLLSPFIGTAFGQTFLTDGTGNWNTPSNLSLGVPNVGSANAFDAVIENGGTAQL